MDRRSVLKAMAGGLVTLAVPPLTGCSAGARLALAPWSGPPPGERDVRMQALAYAVLAPNAHNTQPWRLALYADAIDLYVDPARLLPATDPPFRQAHLSQGTFLEHLVLALGALGQAAEVTYFPEGEYAPSVVEDRPVARVRLAPAALVEDPLFLAIPQRRSNKGLYDPERKVPAEALRALALAAGDSVTVRTFEDPAVRARLTAICADAMAAEVRARPRDEETAKWFRFDDAEMDRERDGFGLAQSGRHGFGKWFLETFIVSREAAKDPDGSFARAAVDLSRDQAASTPCFGALLSTENTRRAQVVAGRAYARLALAAEAHGVALHPMSQALEEYTDMAPVKARLEREVGRPEGSTVQMFFRLGFAPLTPHTPRRDVRAMLRP